MGHARPATWASTSSTSTSTRRSPSRTAAAARVPGRSRYRSGSRRSCRCRGWSNEAANGAGPSFDLDYDQPKSIGRLRGFQGNFGVFVRSYAYIRGLGGDGLAEASETAVLNANYLLARLREAAPAVPAGRLRAPADARVRALRRAAKRELGVKTLDVAKRLLDYGFHPPTVYFPLLVDEALMVEPTETETRESLDALAGPSRRSWPRPRPTWIRARRPTRRRSAARRGRASRRPLIRQPADE